MRAERRTGPALVVGRVKEPYCLRRVEFEISEHQRQSAVKKRIGIPEGQKVER
jgi:hypothetical protein